MSRCFSLLAVGVTLSVGGSVQAATAYDTLGPENSFQVQSWLLGEPVQDQDIAQSFQCWQGGDLETLTISITHYAFQNVYDVRLHADNCGRPGAALEEWLGVEAPAGSILELPSATNVALEQGINYWVAVSTPLGGANTVGGWNYDTIPNNGQTFLFSLRGSAWAPQCGERCGMRVEVSGGSSSTCVGDLDGDGAVGLVDLALLLTHFGTVCP